MSKQKEALKLALEALESGKNHGVAIDVLRRALAEQPVIQQGWDVEDLLDKPKQPAQQQPVVWMYVNRSTHETVFQKHMRSFVDHSQWKEAPLYGEPLANHELQCVCGAVWCGDEMVHLPNKRPPASKPWVGLTQDELSMIGDRMRTWNSHSLVDVYTAIEAKLREKNA